MERTATIEREYGASVAGSPECIRCGSALRPGWTFAFKAGPASVDADGVDRVYEIRKCILCAFRHLPMLRRSLIIASVVGTIITLFNQGDTILAGDWVTALYWKIPISYCVPFCVAMYSALANSRR